MAMEYKLKYTAKEIEDKLEQVDTNTTNIGKISKEVVNKGKSPITTACFWYSNLSDFNGDTDELKAQNIAKYEVLIYQGALCAELEMSSNSYKRDLAIYKRILEINPDFKMFGYITARGFGYISGTNTTTGMTEYRKSPEGIDHPIWTKEEIFDFMNLMAHCGGTLNAEILDEYGNPTRTGGIPMYGVFYDDFGYNYKSQNEHLMNQGDWTSIREKHNCLIDYAHELGLSNMPNDSPADIFDYKASDDYYNPDGLYSTMDERDWFSLESYFVRSDYVFAGADGAASTYNKLYRDIYKSKCLALTYIYAVEDDGIGENAQTAATFALCQALCQGISAIALHGFNQYMQIPEWFCDYYDPDDNAIYSRDDDTWSCTMQVNGRKVTTMRSKSKTSYSQVPNKENLDTCKVVLDDTSAFNNMFIRNEVLTERFERFKSTVEADIDEINNASITADTLHFRALIDDWSNAIPVDEYTNLAPTFEGHYGSSSIVVEYDSTKPYDIKLNMPSGTGSGLWRRIDFNANNLAGKTVELGFKSMSIYPTDGSTANCSYTWWLDKHSNAERIATLNSNTINESIDGTFRPCVQFKVPDDAGVFQLWIHEFTSDYSGAHTIEAEGLYIVDITEMGYEKPKTWYTNYAPSLSTWNKATSYGNVNVTPDADGIGITVDYTSSGFCSELEIKFENNPDIFLSGETWELGIEEYRCWDDAGNDVTHKMQLWFNSQSLQGTGFTFNNYDKNAAFYESSKSELKDGLIRLSRVTFAETYSGGMNNVSFKLKPTNVNGGSSEDNLYHVYIRGLYLYKVDEREDLFIRGEDPSDTYIKINRINEYDPNEKLVGNSLYIVGSGSMFATNRTGEKIDLCGGNIIKSTDNTKLELPVGKCFFKYSGAKVKSTIEDSAVALSKYDLFVYDGDLKTTYNETSEDCEILSLAKRLNPDLKLFMYLSTASCHGDYTLDSDGTWNESNPVTKINTRIEITEFLKRLKHAGGSMSTDEFGNKVYSGGVEFDGVFYDEFDTDNAIGLMNQGGWTSIVEKQNELIDEAHSFGLNAFVNAWSTTSMVSGDVITGLYNPNGLKTHLDERDFILFESNEYTPQINDDNSIMTWATYSTSDRLYQYISNYYNDVKAKAVSYSYGGKYWTAEEKEIALTWIIYNTVAMGGHYVFCNALLDYEIPDNLSVFTINEASMPVYTKTDKGKYVFECNGHTLITHRFNVDSTVLEVNLETLKQTVVSIDNREFVNAFIKAPEYSYAISEQLNHIEGELEEVFNSSQKMSSAYVRAFIDDWKPQITPQSFTNIIPNENGIDNLMAINRQDYNISGEITNSWGSYRWIIDAKPYRGKTLELGCSLYTQSWNASGDARLWFTIYDGIWDNASKTVIYTYTSNESSANNVSKINLSYAVSETQNEIYVGFWAQGAATGGTFEINDIYLVDPTELEEDIVIRGEDPSNTYVRVNRVTSENYEKESELETDSIYIVDNGKFIVTDSNGNKIVETLALPKDENGNLQYGEVGQVAVSDGKGGITWATLSI